MQKVVHVYLIFEKKDFYFGSIAAIYDILSPEQIGIKYNTLRNYDWKNNSVYLTKKAIIKMGMLHRTTQKKVSS